MKKFFFIATIILVILFGILIIVSKGTAVAPFIYGLF